MTSNFVGIQFGKIEVLSSNFGLFILYFFLVLFIGLQLVRIAYYRHKIMSFKVGFLIQCFVSAFLRSLFFLIADYMIDIPWLYIFVYFMPINIQYSTFSLLVVYYGHLQHKQKEEWYSLKRRYFAFWIFTNILFLILAFVWISFDVKYNESNSDDRSWLIDFQSYFTGTIFFGLSVVLAWHSWKVSNLMKEAKGTQTKLLAKVSWYKTLIIAISLFLIFTSRSLYDFISGTDTDLSVDLSSESTAQSLFVFVAFSFWEVVPIILVLILFGNVSPTTLGAFSRTENSKVGPFLFPKNNDNQDTLLKAHLFNDPKRYDSDDENTPVFHKGSPIFYNNSPYVTFAPTDS